MPLQGSKLFQTRTDRTERANACYFQAAGTEDGLPNVLSRTFQNAGTGLVVHLERRSPLLGSGPLPPLAAAARHGCRSAGPRVWRALGTCFSGLSVPAAAAGAPVLPQNTVHGASDCLHWHSEA